MNRTTKALAVTAVSLMATAGLSACSDAPDKTDGAKSDFLPCMVSDSGGFDDKSFNQLPYEGLQKAAKELGSDYKAVESKTKADYKPNIDSLVAQGCDLIITVGFNLSPDTVTAAKANPDTKFAIVDDAADNDHDGKVDAPNIKPLVYDTAQAAFMAGYAAATYSKTGTVGTYGGIPLPTVTIFMDGFKQGVDYFNQQKHKNVKVVGFTGGDKGSFTGDFKANETATNTARQILDKNVDVILPVGGPIYQGALAAMQDLNRPVALIGTDADVFQTDPKTDKVILTSVEKHMDVSTYDTVLAAGKGDWDASAYVGTLENDGVGLAPFHNFESKVPASLQKELDSIKADIISGKIKVSSYLAQ